jgi:small-conductance mechanosensitive channel
VAWAAGSSLTPSVPDLPLEAIVRPDTSEKLKDLEAKLVKIQARVDELQGERDRAIAQINQKQMEIVQVRTEFQQFRGIAVQALEPICDEFSQRSKKMLERLDLMAAQAQALREEFVVRIEKLETDIDQSRQFLQALASDMNTRLSSVIGSPTPAAMPNSKRANDPQPPASPSRPVLPPGELTMTQAMNDLLTANGYAKVIKLTPNKK